MEPSSKKLGTSYGVYLGIALILISVLVYAFDVSLFTEWYMPVLQFLLIIIMGVMAVNKAKKFSQSLFKFKDAFGVYFLTIFIGLLISIIFSYVLFNLVDPQAADIIKELTLEKQVEMFESLGLNEEQINEAITRVQEENNFSLKNLAIGFAIYLAVYSIIGLIVALIFREKEPAHS